MAATPMRAHKRLAALLNQWPRDPATPLNAVSAELGLDIQIGLSDEERKAEAVRGAADWAAANPGQPPLRFTPGDRVECNVGEWAPGKIVHAGPKNNALFENVCRSILYW